jgi:hypothetical protein
MKTFVFACGEPDAYNPCKHIFHVTALTVEKNEYNLYALRQRRGFVTEIENERFYMVRYASLENIPNIVELENYTVFMLMRNDVEMNVPLNMFKIHDSGQLKSIAADVGCFSLTDEGCNLLDQRYFSLQPPPPVAALPRRHSLLAEENALRQSLGIIISQPRGRWFTLEEIFGGRSSDDDIPPEDMLVDVPKRKRILSDGIKKIVENVDLVRPPKHRSVEEMTCLLCVTHEKTVACVPCGHSYCANCIKAALEIKETCPDCREIITDVIPRYD